MNKNSSAISFSILILLLVLGVLLGFTAMYVDQATVRPIILMRDSEVDMRCFLTLIRIQGNDYIRTGQTPPENSLRQKLLDTYNISGTASSTKEYKNLELLGYKGVYVGNEAEFRNELSSSDKLFYCYLRSYGPVEKGFIAIYGENK
ncbi:MAG: hypothetical protein WC376_04490 [Candidatus Nanoarchaeia archaeon]